MAAMRGTHFAPLIEGATLQKSANWKASAGSRAGWHDEEKRLTEAQEYLVEQAHPSRANTTLDCAWRTRMYGV
jgi:hypothetical protein